MRNNPIIDLTKRFRSLVTFGSASLEIGKFGIQTIALLDLLAQKLVGSHTSTESNFSLTPIMTRGMKISVALPMRGVADSSNVKVDLTQAFAIRWLSTCAGLRALCTGKRELELMSMFARFEEIIIRTLVHDDSLHPKVIKVDSLSAKCRIPSHEPSHE
jgi:hypothetical protein